MPTIDGSGIDEVLRAAVDTGAVPHVAAIAADRDGVFYEAWKLYGDFEEALYGALG
jgi:hypothetical protein